jgi:hypothetical protein
MSKNTSVSSGNYFDEFLKLLIALLFPVILSCSSIAEDKRPDEFPVVSYNNLEVSNFNLKISAAMNNGEKWVYHPLLVIQEYRKIADVSFVSILLSNDSVENPLNSTITVVEKMLEDTEEDIRERFDEILQAKKEQNDYLRVLEKIFFRRNYSPVFWRKCDYLMC